MNGSLAYQDEPWEELIDGKVVAMSPRPQIGHYHVCFNIARIFEGYLRGKRCTPFGDGVDLYLTDEEQFIPDGMVVCDPSKIKANGVHGAPDLVVEVLSPSTAKNDRGHKKDVYESCGVGEYWIVNPADKTLEQYLLNEGKYVLHEVYAVHPDWWLEKLKPEERAAIPASFKCSLFEDLEIELSEVFYRVEEESV